MIDGQLLIKTTKKKEIIDITEKVKRFVSQNKIENGLCNLFITHTTASLTTADLDPGTDLDFLDFLTAIIPSINFRHPHDPSHAPDHILSSIIGSSLTLPIKNGQLVLGFWQRIVLIELDGPRERIISINVVN